MGATESRQLPPGSGGSLDSSRGGGGGAPPASGYHVVRVAANSPAHLAGIEPFFDFCVGIDGRPLIVNGAGAGKGGAEGAGGGDDAMAAWRALEEKEGTRVTLNVWSSKRQELRDVEIIPSRSWSTSDPSSSSANTQPSLLGLTLRPCHPSHALSSVWHILDILEHSPAQSAGLVPFGDYVVGYSSGVLRNEGDFYDLVERHEGKPLRLYIYNSDYDHTREVIIVPNREWGGEGLLGCGVGFGLLHRIPRPQDRPPMPQHDGNEDQEEDGGQRTAAAETSQLSSANNSFGAGGGGGVPQSSTDPNLRARAEGGRNGGGGGGDEEDEEGDESHTSGVTISMRRDEDEEEDEEEHEL